MITQRDIDELEKTFVTKDDLKIEVSKLKSDLLDVMDEILKEVRDSRDERIIIAHQVSGHDDRIKTIEDALDITN